MACGKPCSSHGGSLVDVNKVKAGLDVEGHCVEHDARTESSHIGR